MKIGVLHLSDLHLKVGDSSFSLNKIVDAIAVDITDYERLFVAFTGDIVFSGKKDEFDFMDNILGDFLQKIKELKKDIIIDFLMVPGNHDCDFSKSDAARVNNVDMVISKGIDALGSDDSVIDSCTKIQEDFFSFFYKYNEKVKFNGFEKIFYNYVYKFNRVNLIFNCINTSWLSKIKEGYGELMIPVNHEQRKESGVVNSSSLRFAVFHHPYNWLNPRDSNHKDFLRYIVKDNAIALFGHEHSEGEMYLSNDYITSGCVMMESDVFYDGCDYGGFKLLSIDTDFVLISKKYVFDKDRSLFVFSDQKKHDLKNSVLNGNGFYISDDFKCYLGDCGVVSKHPSNKIIDLKGLFVYPKLRDLLSEENAFIRSKDLMKNVSSGDFVILCGQDQIGKTSLFKMFYNDLYQDGIVPIYIDGEKDIVNDNVGQLIKKMVRIQYRGGEKKNEEYLALNKNKRYLLIDNFHLIKKNVEVKKLIKLLKCHFDVVIASSGLTDRFDNFSGNIDGMDSVKIYDIMRFGGVEREELIKKWLSYYNTDEGILLDRRVRLHAKIDDIIGKNVVPSYPVFLITILHSLEGDNMSQQEITSYGYCYQTLIYLLLRYSKVQEKDVDSYLNFLTYLSYYMYENKVSSLNNSGFDSFFEKYSAQFVFKEYKERVICLLADSRILQIDSMGNISFKYMYVYYYFVAKYISDYRVNDDDLIGWLCSNVQEKESVFILLFLTHHTKSSKVIDEIMLNTMCLYDGYDPLCLGNDDALFTENFVEEVVGMVMEKIDPEVYRDRLLADKDKIAEEALAKKGMLDDDFGCDDIDDIKFNGNINNDFINAHAIEFKKASMSININGMIIKNRYGSIKKERLQGIIEEVYFLCFRMMTYMREFFMSDTVIDTIVNGVREMLRESGFLVVGDISIREVIEKKVRMFMSNFIYIINYSLMESTSYSIGCDKLDSIYDSVAKKHDYSLFKLLTFMTKIKATNMLDVEELKRLKALVKDNVLLYNILKRSVVEYLYMHHMHYKDKARIAQIIGIKIRDQIVMREKYEDKI